MLFFITLFLILPRPGYFLECYSCSAQLEHYESGYRNNCESFWVNSDWDRNQIAHCLHADSVCSKFIVDHGGMRWVHRSCAPFDFCNELQQRYSNPLDMLLECTTCSDENLCNSSSKSVATLVVIVINFASWLIFHQKIL